jgi:hypothetical protein
MTIEDIKFYKLTKPQIDLFKRTGLIPYPTITGTLDIGTGEGVIDWEMPKDIEMYIKKQLGIE